MSQTPDEITPDDKDWTWTIEGRCDECGYDAGAIPPAGIAAEIRSLTAPWGDVLARPEAAERPAPGIWSALEYACHVRDVCALFAERTRLMLAEDAPTFGNWDGDAAALAYAGSDPRAVARELAAAGEAFAAAHDAATEDTAEDAATTSSHDRTGIRGDGRTFTVAGLGRYGLHELAHHLWDVRPAD